MSWSNLWYGDEAPKINQNRARGFDYRKFQGDLVDWLYLCLVHRITGSGASFEHDHGWRNTCVPEMAELKTIDKMSKFVGSYQRPLFTSIGNQIPPFNKLQDPATYRTAGQEYLATVAPNLVRNFFQCIDQRAGPALGIKPAVDLILSMQSEMGYKRFAFVLTAFVMDIAEYAPYLVDPNSDCYHGKNAKEALLTCFKPKNKSQDFFDAGTRCFADFTQTHPMDVEDAAPGCDLIRWLENYVPKRGFEHVLKWIFTIARRSFIIRGDNHRGVFMPHNNHTTSNSHKELDKFTRDALLGLLKDWKDPFPVPGLVDYRTQDGRTVYVVRDDLIDFGTKARAGDAVLNSPQYRNCKTLVYVAPRVGWAAISLAKLAKRYKKRLVVFCPACKEPSDHQK